MTKRYFAENLQLGSNVELPDQESHHFLHVMRGQVGDRITLFDGSGFEFAANVVSVSRKSVAVEIVESSKISRELSIQMTIACCLPKGDRQKFLIEKLSELGVKRLIPITSDRSNVKTEKFSLQKLRRVCVETAKQCERNELMEIADPLKTGDLFISDFDQFQFVAHPHSNRPLSAVQTDGSLTIAIGPEGGFTDSEIEQATGNGWNAFPLGRSILRTETAAIMSASVIRAQLIEYEKNE